MGGEMGSSALELALMFWFFIIAICFFYGLYKLLQWIYSRRKPQKVHESLQQCKRKEQRFLKQPNWNNVFAYRRFLQKTNNWIAHNIIVTLMRGLYRIAVYALVTAIVEGIFIWGLFTYAEANKLTIWFVLAENFGMLLFLPYQGPPSTGFFALIIGIICWFLIITAIGETINWLGKEKQPILQCLCIRKQKKDEVRSQCFH